MPYLVPLPFDFVALARQGVIELSVGRLLPNVDLIERSTMCGFQIRRMFLAVAFGADAPVVSEGVEFYDIDANGDVFANVNIDAVRAATAR